MSNKPEASEICRKCVEEFGEPFDLEMCKECRKVSNIQNEPAAVKRKPIHEGD
jgi:hypothetical protein